MSVSGGNIQFKVFPMSNKTTDYLWKEGIARLASEKFLENLSY